MRWRDGPRQRGRRFRDADEAEHYRPRDPGGDRRHRDEGPVLPRRGHGPGLVDTLNDLRRVMLGWIGLHANERYHRVASAVFAMTGATWTIGGVFLATASAFDLTPDEQLMPAPRGALGATSDWAGPGAGPLPLPGGGGRLPERTRGSACCRATPA